MAMRWGDSKYVVYTRPWGLDLLSVKVGGSWTYRNLTSEFDAPRPHTHSFPPIRGFGWELPQMRSLAYFDMDGQLYDVTAGMSGKWVSTDVTAETGAAPYTFLTGIVG